MAASIRLLGCGDLSRDGCKRRAPAVLDQNPHQFTYRRDLLGFEQMIEAG
jgi:hypothetical protein